MLELFQKKSTPYLAFGFCFRLFIVAMVCAAENEQGVRECQLFHVQSAQYFKKSWLIIFLCD
jgi:hypothetical protein